MSTDERLLLAVSAASPVTSNGDCSYRHQEDDDHVVVQHWLIGCIHGNQSSLAKGLYELKAALSQVKAKDFSNQTCNNLHSAEIVFLLETSASQNVKVLFNCAELSGPIRQTQVGTSLSMMAAGLSPCLCPAYPSS